MTSANPMNKPIFWIEKGGYSRPMDILPGGFRRVTMPLPNRPGHVHAYLLPAGDDWTLVDNGLGLPDAAERWARELAQVDRPVTRIVVTHFHPDHVGAADDLAELTGAPVLQGRLDFEQCVQVWGSDDWAPVVDGWFGRNGVPPDVTDELVEQGLFYRSLVRYAAAPELLEAGDRIGGWEVVPAPGHADGQLTLFKDGVLVAADHVLTPITPTVGLWPASRPRSARRLPGCARAHDRTRALACVAGPRRPDPRSRRPRPGADRSSPGPPRRDRRRPRLGAA